MTNLKVFQDKKELLKSLPALSASDFIIYDTADQDETKPFVLVSFSFYDDKIGSTVYQVKTETSLGNFITGASAVSGGTGNGQVLYDVRTYYYDKIIAQWVLAEVNTRTSTATSIAGLKGSVNNIVYATRDIYTSSSAMYKKDPRLLLSGRFRNESPFDEFFQEEHLNRLGYENGDDLLRVKYANDNHLLFVIKGSTSPLKAIYSGSYYYNLTLTGTVKGLQCQNGVYTEVSSLAHVGSKTLAFDDYVLYSTLDITHQDRLMRVKDHYVVGTRDEIVSVSPDPIQIKEPPVFKAQTNPDGLPVRRLIESPESYDVIKEELVQLQAGNSYPYEHWFETVDLVGEWARRPLPPKKTVANFYDGNAYRIVFQHKETEYRMLTFNMEEGCNIYWANSSYGYWYFSDKTKASNFIIYPLTPDGVGEGVSVDWHSSSYNYLNTSMTQVYKRDVECVFFSNATIYDRDMATVLVESSTLSELYPHYFHLKSAGFDLDCRIKIGEPWEDSLQIDYEHGEGVTIQSITFGEDYEPVYQKAGSYYLTVHVTVEQQPDETLSCPFLLNIYDEEFLSYPNHVPFPVQDGTQEAIVYQRGGEIYLMTYTATSHIHLYQYTATRLDFFDGHPDGGYGATSGESLYLLKDQKWVYQPTKQQFPYPYPRTSIQYTNIQADILYSTVNIYSSKTLSDEKIVRLADSKFPSKDYEIGMRYYEIPFKLPSVSALLKEHSSNHYFITYQTKVATLCVMVPSVIEDFCLKVTGVSNSFTLAPSVKLNTVHYYSFDGTTEDWVFKGNGTNATTFNTSYISDLTASFKMNGSSTSTYLSINERIAYTSIPVYIQRSKDTINDPILIRDPDNKLVADENSIAPTVIDILTGQEEPYTVDTKFTFDLACEFEDIEGNFITKTEWENKQLKYPVGSNPVRARVRDNRELWSEWFEKTITIERPKMSANAILGVHDLPLQANGEAYDHYLIFKYHATNALAYRCWGFVLKEGVESFKVASYNNSLYFSDYTNKIFEKVDWYTGYDSTTGWGNRTALNLGYTNYNGGVLNSLASNIYYSTFPVYTDTKYTEILAYPLTSVPPLPFKIALTSTHEDVWTNEDVTIRYEIETLNQPHKEIKYRVNNGEYIPLTELIGRLTFNQSGIYTVEVVAVNQDDVASTATISFKIDKDAPTVSVVDQGAQLAFTITDLHSGLNTAHYRLATIDGVEQNNGWTKITPTGSIKKPIYGGRYIYEFKLIDNLNNTAIIEHVFDLEKIHIESVLVEPQSFDLKYNQSQKLSVQLLPETHNTPYTITYESLSPYVSVSTVGVVSINNRYFTGEAQIKVKVNEFEEIVTANCYVDKLAYPEGYPPIYDLYNYPDYSDFIIYKYSSNTYRMLAFNREDNEAIFYIRSGNLYYSIPNTILEAACFDRLDENSWNRNGSRLNGVNYLSTSFYSNYPHETIVFSTVDIYSNETGELLARPKDVLPPMVYPVVRLETNGYDGSWTNTLNFQIFGEDMGSGLSKLTYQINKESEIEVEAGETITLAGRETGVYQFKAYAYNDYNVRAASETIEVKWDVTLPSLAIRQVFDKNNLVHNINLTASDANALLSTIQYRVDGSEWEVMDVEGQSKVTTTLYSFDVMDIGTRHIEVVATDLAGNQTATEFVSVVELQTPSSISCSPGSINLREGARKQLTITVNVLGTYSEDEITFSGYDEEIIQMDGFTVICLQEGKTSLTVSCRGVSTTISVVVQPAYPDVLPSKYDLYWFDEEFSDFIIAEYGSAYYLHLLNRTDEEAWFYIAYHNSYNRLHCSSSTHVIDYAQSTLKPDKKWARKLSVSKPNSSVINSACFNSRDPYMCVAFSTVDLYNEAGTELIRPKDTLPPTQLAEILLNLNDYNGEWTQDPNITVSGVDTGGGIHQVIYSFDGGVTEIEVENGGKIEFSKSGQHKIIAAVYNDDLAPHKVALDTPIKIDQTAPTIALGKSYLSGSKVYSVVLNSKDTHSGVREVRYRRQGGDWTVDYFDDVPSANYYFMDIPYTEWGTQLVEVEVYDAAGNMATESLEFDIPRPKPTGINVEPNPINLLLGQSTELNITVEVEGRLEEDEIIITSEDEQVAVIDGHIVRAVGVGETQITVECRGVVTHVPVVVRAFKPSHTKVKINNRFVSFFVSDTETCVKVRENGEWVSLVTLDEYPTYAGSDDVKVRINNEWKVLPTCE